MPKRPLQTLHLEFYGTLLTNEYLFVTINRYLRYPEVKVVKSKLSNTIIPKFVVHELPNKVVTENQC